MLLPLSIRITLFGCCFVLCWGEPATITQGTSFVFVWQFGLYIYKVDSYIFFDNVRNVLATKEDITRIRHRWAIHRMHEEQAFNLRMYGSKVIDTNR